MNNFIQILNTPRNIKHLANMPIKALEIEINLLKLIHPTGEENLEKMLEGFDQITITKPSDECLEKCKFKHEGGVYGIRCGKKNDYIYIGETSRSLEQRISEHFSQYKTKTHTNKNLCKEIEESSEITLYFFEHHRVKESLKLKFKIYCLFREFYYQELFLNNKFKLLSKEDSLHKFFTLTKFFTYPYVENGIGYLLLCREFYPEMTIKDTSKVESFKIKESEITYDWGIFKEQFYKSKYSK